MLITILKVNVTTVSALSNLVGERVGTEKGRLGVTEGAAVMGRVTFTKETLPLYHTSDESAWEKELPMQMEDTPVVFCIHCDVKRY